MVITDKNGNELGTICGTLTNASKIEYSPSLKSIRHVDHNGVKTIMGINRGDPMVALGDGYVVMLLGIKIVLFKNVIGPDNVVFEHIFGRSDETLTFS